MSEKCECHECTQVRWKSSLQGQVHAAMGARPIVGGGLLEALEDLLREIDEKEWAGCNSVLYQQAEAAIRKAKSE